MEKQKKKKKGFQILRIPGKKQNSARFRGLAELTKIDEQLKKRLTFRFSRNKKVHFLAFLRKAIKKGAFLQIFTFKRGLFFRIFTLSD